MGLPAAVERRGIVGAYLQLKADISLAVCAPLEGRDSLATRGGDRVAARLREQYAGVRIGMKPRELL